MDLFLDRLKNLEKKAGYSARLSESPETWPQELSSELYKQLPFVSDYDMQVNLDRVEPQRGFAFGYADLANKTERPETEHTAAGMPHVRIPLVITERGVKPFTVFLDGEKVLPLTEERMRESLFNPATFDLSSTPPRDPSLVEPLMPPNRSSMGYGGDYKTASARPSLLQAIADTISEKDAHAFIQKVASSPTLIAGFRRSGIAERLVDVFENTKRASADERLAAIADQIEPTVVTLQKLPGGDFLVKQANVGAFAGGQAAQGQVVPGAEVAEAIGQETAQGMQPGQTATAVANPVQAMQVSEFNGKPVDQFGEYKVTDAVGNTLMGWVFPQTLAWDGNFTPQGVSLFTNGSSYAVQEAVMGELVGKGTNLPKDPPRGDGAFYFVDGGEAIATAPITVGSVVAGPDGLPRFMATDLFGTQLSISQVEGIKEPMRVSDVEYAIPTHWKFMRLNNQTQLGNHEPSAEPVEPMPQQPDIAAQPMANAPAAVGMPAGAKGKSPSMNKGPGPQSPVEQRGQPPAPGAQGVPPPQMNMGNLGQPQPMVGMPGAVENPESPEAPQKPGAAKTPGKPGEAKAGKPEAKKPGEEKKPEAGKPAAKPGKPGEPAKPSAAKKPEAKAKLKEKKSTVVLFFNGSYNIEGGCGLEKISTDLRYDLDPVSAEFILGLLGVDGGTAKQKVAEARKRGSVKLAGLRSITTLAERYAEGVKTASAILLQFPTLKRDLIKEAATLPDESTADSILALNFINPENISTFISYLPELEQTSEKMSEMLLSSYVGAQELPEDALERSMRNLEEVILGLKSIQHAEA